MKKEIKKIALTDLMYFYTNANWQCGLTDDNGDDNEVKLGLVLEIMDTRDFDDKADENYPYTFSLGIMAAKPHDSFYEGEGKPELSGLLYDCYSYMGSVPVYHIFLNTDGINKKLLDKLSVRDAKLVTITPEWGTIAAQNGKGSEFTYPQFKDDSKCLEFAESLIEAYHSPIMGLIGFTLDRPINLMGESGWTTIEKQARGK